MGKRQISNIILYETVFVGIISLLVGLVLGIFLSQFMSVIVAKMFEADMSEFQFVFSKSACIKTCIYFAIMYLAVIFFNTLTISRYRLINLLNSNKKNEKVRFKNPFLAIIVFLGACFILGYAYKLVLGPVNSFSSFKKLLPPILMGIVGTILIFWSLSGFILQIVQMIKKIYLKDTNMFILRQLNNKINTTVISMSVICLMLFMTITILSCALSIRETMQAEMKEMTPVDINLTEMANVGEIYDSGWQRGPSTEEQRKASRVPIVETLKENGLNMNVLKDIVEIPIYSQEGFTLKEFLGDDFEEIDKLYPFMIFSTPEKIIKISDYNKIARLYGIKEYSLKDNEYIMVCNFDGMIEVRNVALKDGNKIEIAGKEYISKYKECKDGFIEISASHTETGIILVPDSCKLTDDMKYKMFLAANYNSDTEEGKEEIEQNFVDGSEADLIKNLESKGIVIDGMSKIAIIESSVGLTTIITFIAIYLGIIFLIASSAILALKQLTESSDNKQRYTILRKIGCDEKIINKSLFRQIGIFFMLPLILAIIHSIFGIKFGLKVMSEIANQNQLLPSIIATVVLISIIYVSYFLATYYSSKSIIKEE